jgi:hypothetical protein
MPTMPTMPTMQTMQTMPTMQTMQTMQSRTYAEVLKTPWSQKKELEKKKQHVCLLDVLEGCLEAVPASGKLLDEASDDASSCFSYDFDPPLRRGLIVEEEEEGYEPWHFQIMGL